MTLADGFGRSEPRPVSPRARGFAKELGVEENTLTSWERGLRLIEPEDLDGVRRLTGITADYIYYGDSTGLPPATIERLKLD